MRWVLFYMVPVLIGGTLATATEHPVYPVNLTDRQVRRLERRVQPVMVLSESEMVALIPDKTGFRFVGCPDCDEGAQEGQLTWSIHDPHRVQCKYCEMVFPNEKYPDDGVLEVVNPVGETVTYPYWEDETGYRYQFQAKAWREARIYFAGIAEDLGQLYQATGEAKYARRSALILDVFARYYPGFLVSYDRAHEQKGFVFEPPYPNNGGKWGRWRADEIPTNVVMAYDAIYNSGELERLSDSLGVNVKKRIEEDFFRGLIHQEQFQEITYGNASPRLYVGYAVVGRVLGDPELVHEAVRRSVGLFERRFSSDGFWSEGSLGYHRMTMAGMKGVFDMLKGYSDPPGYVSSEDVRYDDLDMERDIAIVRQANKVLDIARYPDGRFIPMHDAWARLESRRVDPNLNPLDESHSTLLAGVGHAWLGRGKGDDQVQVHLHFSGAYGHAHADNLNVMLFAKGQELLPDVGYTHTRYRRWTRSTLCHNTVVIDEKEQEVSDRKGVTDGALHAFESAHEMVQWIDVSGERAYPGLAGEYRRQVMLVHAGNGDHYVIDLFRVQGGNQHDWVIHGHADYDVDVDVNVPLEAFGENLLPGVKVKFPEHERDEGDAQGRNINYAFFQNVSRGKHTGNVLATFGKHDSVSLRTHLLGIEGSEIFVGDAPSVRRADEDEPMLDHFRMPMLMVRREGKLSSQFLAVHEPFKGDVFIDSVEVENFGDRGIYLKVEHRGVIDHLMLSAGKDQFQTANSAFLGEVGFVRERNGQVEALGLWGGEEIAWGDAKLVGRGTLKGQVTDVLRIQDGDPYHALVVHGMDEDGDLGGSMAVVTFGDGTTRGMRVTRLQGKHLILEQDPGFRMTESGMEHCFFPLRSIAGQVSVQIRTSGFVTLQNGVVNKAFVGTGDFETK